MKLVWGWVTWLIAWGLTLAAAGHSVSSTQTVHLHNRGRAHHRRSKKFQARTANHLVRASFKFEDSPKPLHPWSGSFLESRTNCSLPRGMKFRQMQTPKLVNLLTTRKPFTFVRIGDGDWYCALGGTGADSNGVAMETQNGMCDTLQRDIKDYGAKGDANFFPVLGTFFLCKEKSADIFLHVDSFFSYNPMHHGFSGFLNSNDVGFYFPLVPPPQIGRAPGVLPLLAGQVVVLVGPKHLGKLHVMLNYSAHIDVPLHTAWEAKDVITAGIRHESSRHAGETVVFLVAGGIATRTMLYQMFLELGQTSTFIDVGASLDGFAGVVSRDYNKNTSTICQQYPEYVVSGMCPEHASTPAASPTKFIRHDIKSSHESKAKMLNAGQTMDEDNDDDDDDNDNADDDDTTSAKSIKDDSAAEDNGGEDDDDDDDDSKPEGRPPSSSKLPAPKPVNDKPCSIQCLVWSYVPSVLQSYLRTIVALFFPIAGERFTGSQSC